MKISLKILPLKVFYLFIASQYNLYADCADKWIRCHNGVQVKLNYKYNWREARCLPMQTGGGDSLDVAMANCQNHGGLDHNSIPQGYGWTEFVEAAAKFGFTIYGYYQESQQGKPPVNRSAPEKNTGPVSKLTPQALNNDSKSTNPVKPSGESVEKMQPLETDDELEKLLNDLNNVGKI